MPASDGTLPRRLGVEQGRGRDLAYRLVNLQCFIGTQHRPALQFFCLWGACFSYGKL